MVCSHKVEQVGLLWVLQFLPAVRPQKRLHLSKPQRSLITGHNLHFNPKIKRLNFQDVVIIFNIVEYTNLVDSMFCISVKIGVPVPSGGSVVTAGATTFFSKYMT